MLKISMFLHQNCPKISKVVLNVKAFKTLIKLTCLAEKFKAQPDHICLEFFFMDLPVSNQLQVIKLYLDI